MLHYDYGQPNYYTADVDGASVGNHTVKASETDYPLETGQYEHEYLVFRREEICDSPYPLAPEPQPSGESCTNTAYWASSDFERGTELLHLHAPVPLPGCAPFLRTQSYQSDETKMIESVGCPPTHFVAPPYQSNIQPHVCLSVPQGDYDHVLRAPSAVPPQPTFPTPSELLVELSSQESQHPSRTARGHVYIPERSSRSIYPSGSTAEMTPVLDPAFLPPSPVNDTVTESITSHEKKRHYLECLEHYVAFLHEHFRCNGLEPAPLERISNYRCLNSRSIRSLLIHMEKLTKQMKEQIFKEEQKFLRLRDTLHRQEADIQVAQGVQHGR